MRDNFNFADIYTLNVAPIAGFRKQSYLIHSSESIHLDRGERRMWFSLVLIQYTMYWRNWQVLESHHREKARELDLNNLIHGPLLLYPSSV